MKSLLVRDYMSRKPATVKCGTTLSNAADTLLRHHIAGAPVVDEVNQVVGFISEQDCLQPLMVSSYHHEAEKRVNEVMSNQVLSVSPNDTIVELAKRMNINKPKIYPVIEDNQLVGVITRSDILRVLADEGCEARFKVVMS